MTLTELSYYSRKMMPFVILVVILLLILIVAIQIIILLVSNEQPEEDANGQQQQTITSPAQQETNEATDATQAPTAASESAYEAKFGAVIAPLIQEGRPSSAFTYSYAGGETVPDIGVENVEVYPVKQATGAAGVRQRAFPLAQAVGFDTETAKFEEKPEENKVTFSDGVRTLDMDTRTFNFNFQYKLSSSDRLLQRADPPDKARAEQTATEFLRSVNAYPEALAQGKTTTFFVKFDTDFNQLTIVDSPEEANMVEVDFNKPDILSSGQTIPVISERYFNTQNFVIMIPDDREYRIVRAQFNYYEPVPEEASTYPIKTAQEAWDAFAAGQGYVVSAPSGENTPVSIQDVSLAYLDQNEPYEYLQPVYVFLGENSFVGYLPALQDEYLEINPAQSQQAPPEQSQQNQQDEEPGTEEDLEDREQTDQTETNTDENPDASPENEENSPDNSNDGRNNDRGGVIQYESTN